MKRYQIVLCILAAVSTVVALWFVYRCVYEQFIGFALFLIFLALVALTN